MPGESDEAVILNKGYHAAPRWIGKSILITGNCANEVNIVGIILLHTVITDIPHIEITNHYGGHTIWFGHSADQEVNYTQVYKVNELSLEAGWAVTLDGWSDMLAAGMNPKSFWAVKHLVKKLKITVTDFNVAPCYLGIVWSRWIDFPSPDAALDVVSPIASLPPGP
jgi:hypothetical protein